MPHSIACDLLTFDFQAKSVTVSQWVAAGRFHEEWLHLSHICNDLDIVYYIVGSLTIQYFSHTIFGRSVASLRRLLSNKMFILFVWD